MKTKMYILVKDSIPLGKGLVAVSHASLACYLKFKDTTDMQEWLSNSFYKVICKVNDKEFEKAKTFENNVVLTESTLDNQEVAIAFNPRQEYPKPFNFYQLYK
jgi:peptidyl-tRNA hydrolase